MRAIVFLTVLGPIFSYAGIIDTETALAVKTERKRLALYDLIAQIEAAANHLQVEVE